MSALGLTLSGIRQRFAHVRIEGAVIRKTGQRENGRKSEKVGGVGCLPDVNG